MFRYYGAKGRIARYYDPPRYDYIVEPFAGSARYALLYCDNGVWINDAYEVIANIWRWIQQATAQDIKSLPVLRQGERLSDVKGLSQPERDLLGFCAMPGIPAPGDRTNRWSDGKPAEILKRRLLKMVGRIRHWRITNLSFDELPNMTATWFIDPPYQFGGDLYVKKGIDYPKLMAWIQGRHGDTITCENDRNDWLDRWQPLCRMVGQRKITYEVVRYSYKRMDSLGLLKPGEGLSVDKIRTRTKGNEDASSDQETGRIAGSRHSKRRAR